eukprot:3664769-Pyramimonas_sp.AAC.1
MQPALQMSELSSQGSPSTISGARYCRVPTWVGDGFVPFASRRGRRTTLTTSTPTSEALSSNAPQG